MDATSGTTQLAEALQLVEGVRLQQAAALQGMAAAQAENATPRHELEPLRHDHAALLDAAAKVMADRDRLQQREAELEAINQRLVDML